MPGVTSVYFDNGDDTWHVDFNIDVSALDFTGSTLTVPGAVNAWDGNVGSTATYEPGFDSQDAGQGYIVDGLPPPFPGAAHGFTSAPV